jgi:hypothetical protein
VTVLGTIELRCSGCGKRQVFIALYPLVFRCACADTIVTGAQS